MDVQNDSPGSIDPSSHEEARRREDIPPSFVEETLACYFEGCRYLQAASLEVRPDARPFESAYGRVLALARGRFTGVPPWYIRDTGHFNSIELNLCYNQLTYVALAHAAVTGAVPWFSVYMQGEQAQTRKLTDVLITSFSSRFIREMRAEHFTGDFWVEKAVARNDKLFLRTGMAVFDPNGEQCSTATVQAVVVERRHGGADA